jgi:hypothetical protein
MNYKIPLDELGDMNSMYAATRLIKEDNTVTLVARRREFYVNILHTEAYCGLCATRFEYRSNKECPTCGCHDYEWMQKFTPYQYMTVYSLIDKGDIITHRESKYYLVCNGEGKMFIKNAYCWHTINKKTGRMLTIIQDYGKRKKRFISGITYADIACEHDAVFFNDRYIDKISEYSILRSTLMMCMLHPPFMNVWKECPDIADYIVDKCGKRPTVVRKIMQQTNPRKIMEVGLGFPINKDMRLFLRNINGCDAPSILNIIYTLSKYAPMHIVLEAMQKADLANLMSTYALENVIHRVYELGGQRAVIRMLKRDVLPHDFRIRLDAMRMGIVDISGDIEEVRRMHDQIMYRRALSRYSEHKDKLDAMYPARYERLRKFEYSEGDLRIIAPATLMDIIEEGRSMNHCVGTYAGAHAIGDTSIFFLRKGDERIGTIEVRQGEIHQAYGYGNSILKEEYHEFLNRWKAAFGNKFHDLTDRVW